MSSSALFVFPSASGHVNPSLPVAKSLISKGWSVAFLATPDYKDAIAATGSTFIDRDEVCAERGVNDVTKTVMSTASLYGDPPPQWWLNFGSISTEMLLPIYIDFLRALSPNLVVYCPVLCQVAYFAALHLRIPAVSLLTTAGPGYFDAAIASMAGAAAVRSVASDLVKEVAASSANATAIASIRSQLSLPAATPPLTLNTSEPLCCDYYASTNLVSTTTSLSDPMCEADERYYEEAGKKFFFVGPLLDETSSCNRRAAGSGALVDDDDSVMSSVLAASSANRRIVYVSMGTVITSDNAEHGWSATSGSGITGRNLCQSVYRAVFQELQEKDDEEDGSGPLIVVSMGRPLKEAMGGIRCPKNALCAESVKQVELLRSGKPSLFVTNGGQNSLMESMTVGTPVLVCPGFGDQLSNASKVVAKGWGKRVDRPKAVAGDDGVGDAAALAAYEAAVRSGVREVLAGGEFAEQAKIIADGLERAEGVDGAVRVLIEEAGKGEKGTK
jgi:UDP-N-acetylglucosamine:LPS N-acetylglucosamine transferase